MNPENKIIHVAVAVIRDSNGRFLITKRPENSHQGGLWEFPGGKLEQDESVEQALKREIAEEVGLDVESVSPLIRINHDYGDKSVLLDVWYVEKYSGNASGREGQELRWICVEDLTNYAFPAANQAIIKALRLPDQYMITGDFDDFSALYKSLDAGLNKGIKLVQFRAHKLDDDDYFDYAKKLSNLCNEYNATLLLNTAFHKYIECQAYEFSHGIHLTTKELKSLERETLTPEFIISASVHNVNELDYAINSNLDFIVASPVKKTLSHPGRPVLGWGKFRDITEQATMPVYALGGMTNADLLMAKQHGGQGISAISEFWVRSKL